MQTSSAGAGAVAAAAGVLLATLPPTASQDRSRREGRRSLPLAFTGHRLRPK
jgi:hypothetical protein